MKTKRKQMEHLDAEDLNLVSLAQEYSATVLGELRHTPEDSPFRDERNRDGKWIPVTDGNCSELIEIVRLAKKHNSRFDISDFKDGDIVRLKDDEHIVRIYGAAALFVHLLFQFDECVSARDKRHCASTTLARR